MTTYLGKSCSFGLPRVPFVNCGHDVGSDCISSWSLLIFLLCFKSLFHGSNSDWLFRDFVFFISRIVILLWFRIIAGIVFLPRVPFVNWGHDVGSDCISSWSLLIFLLCFKSLFHGSNSDWLFRDFVFFIIRIVILLWFRIIAGIVFALFVLFTNVAF